MLKRIKPITIWFLVLLRALLFCVAFFLFFFCCVNVQWFKPFLYPEKMIRGVCKTKAVICVVLFRQSRRSPAIATKVAPDN